ncbi:MAG: DUF1559 domain-containing protein, partial [bacterium]|nr:DUF1559 domain-containing protein [bacterium]
MVADIKDRQKLESLNAQLVKAVNDYADANPNQGKDWGRSFEEPRAVPFEEPRFEGELEEESSEAEPERSFGRAEILPRTESAKDAVRDAAANDECFDDPFGATEEAAEVFDGEEFREAEFGEEHIGGPVGVADTPFGELFQTMFVGSLRIKEKEVAGKKYYMAHFTSYLVPVAPSWGFTDKHLVVGLFPQTVKEFLTRPDDFQSLDTNPEIASRLGDDTLGVAQVDSKAMFETIYSFLEMGMFSAATVDSGEADDSAALLNAITNMPATADIAQHIGPSTILIRPTDQGIEMISHQSFPGGGVGALAPVAVAAMAPAVMAARAAARQAQATNNLKQLGLAMHNYHDVYTHFPAAYTADKEGKPLLSWRVHLLPFIEGGALYEKFHLDEPWDS